MHSPVARQVRRPATQPVGRNANAGVMYVDAASCVRRSRRGGGLHPVPVSVIRYLDRGCQRRRWPNGSSSPWSPDEHVVQTAAQSVDALLRIQNCALCAAPIQLGFGPSHFFSPLCRETLCLRALQDERTAHRGGVAVRSSSSITVRSTPSITVRSTLPTTVRSTLPIAARPWMPRRH